ncbi:MAG: hypothetical protein WB919_16960 [Candidatus Sulfotelmatobacter sp.]
MTLPDEPEGWQALQAIAQQENDPQKLASVIDQMNRLLDKHYKKQATAGGHSILVIPKTVDCTVKLNVELVQLE